MAHTYTTEGIILRHHDFRERDRMLAIYTKEYGKMTARAISSRALTAKLAGFIEPFIVARLFFASSRTIDILGDSYPEETNVHLRSNIIKNTHALYFVEMVDRLTQDREPDLALYDHVRSVLRWMNMHDAQPLILHAALLQLLRLLGYSFNFYECHRCGRAMADGAKFVTKISHVECGDCRSVDDVVRLEIDTIKILRFLTEQPFANIVRLQITSAQWGKFRAFVIGLYRYHLEDDVRSEAVMPAMLRAVSAESIA